MRRRQVPTQQDPKQLNTAFLLKFAKLNFQAKPINPQILNVFSNFLQHLSDNILRQQYSYTYETIKALIDIIITAEFNLHMTEDLFASTSGIEPVIKFLQTLFNFADKLFVYGHKPNSQKVTEIIDLFWPLLSNQKEIQKVEVKNFDKIALALQKITNLPSVHEIESYTPKISSESIINESVQIAFVTQNLQFPTVFKSVLSKYNEKNKAFIENFLVYFQTLMNDQKDQRALFQKCFNLLINISNSVGQKYNYFEIFFNRLISSTNPIRNFSYALIALQDSTGVEKYYSYNHLLKLSFIIIEKILNKRAINKQATQALELIAELSQNWTDFAPEDFNVNDFSQKNNSNLLFQIIRFIIPTGKTQQNVNPLSQAMILQNSLIEAEKALFESGEMDGRKFYQFFKQYEMRSDNQDADEWMDNSNKTTFGRIQGSEKAEVYIGLIKNFQTIILNLSKNKFLLPQFKLTSIQKLQELLHDSFVKQSESQDQQKTILNQISAFIIRCLPNLIPDDWNEVLLKKYLLSGSQESKRSKPKFAQNAIIIEIIQSILIKKLEQTENFSKLKQDLPFQEFIDNVFTEDLGQQQILNFHFLIFYIFFKKSSSLQEKEEIAELQSICHVLFKKLNQFLEKYFKLMEKKNTELEKLKKSVSILKFFLIMILDHPSSSFKLSLKKIFTKQGQNLTKKLNLYDLITINQKQTANSFFNSRAKTILGFSQEGQTSLGKSFLNVVEKLNKINFPENYLRLGTESKQDKNMKIFLNIKLNNIALSLKKSHKVPQLIQNINLMRKTNSINSFEIHLLSFCEFFDKLTNEPKETENNKKQILKVQQSQLIVAFNYLLKMNILISKYNEKLNEELENDVSYKIDTLQDIHALIQDTLCSIQKLILEQNQVFDLLTLIEILQNIRESSHSTGGIIQKYTDFINDGQIIRLISELTDDSQKLRIQFSQLALVTMKKLLSKDQKITENIKQLQKIKLEERGNQMNIENQQQQAPQVENKNPQMKDLSPKLKQLYLMYYPSKHDVSLGNMLRVKTQVSILQLFEDPLQIINLTKQSIENLSNSIVEDLLKNISLVKEIILKQSQQESTQNEELIWNFKYIGENKFINFIIRQILKMFSPSQKDTISFNFTDKLFSISSQVLENEQICELAKKQIGNDLNRQFIRMVSGRIEDGCQMVRKIFESTSPTKKGRKNTSDDIESKNKQIKGFHSASTKLYNIIKKVINLESFSSEQIVNSLISKDQFVSIEVTKFLLAELINVSTFIKTKSDTLTETVFSYVIKANESYHAGKSKLQIPEFLCEFFNISHADDFRNQIQSLEKTERSTNNCTTNISYRCLKCDDRRMICYSCVIECHKGHPVIYLADQRFPKCQCKQIGTDQCKLIKKVEEGKVQKPQRFNNLFSYEPRPMRTNRHQFFMMDQDRGYEPLHIYEEDDFREPYRLGGARIRNPREYEQMGRENIFSLQPNERVQSILGPQLTRQEKKNELSNEKLSQENFDFEDENYLSSSTQMETQETTKSHATTSIESQSYLLPVFLQMFNDIYSSNEEVSSQKVCQQNEKFGFNSLMVGKVMHNAWKGSGSGNYTVRLRRENQLNNKSPSVSKQTIAQNQKFILIASGSIIFSHSKERYLMSLLDGKQSQSLSIANQFTGNFDIHTIDFSQSDESIFVISGLHNIIMLNINNDGFITKNTQQQRISVNNDYINKVRTSSLGIFYSTSYEIKLLSWTFKPVLTIKSSAECLLKEWCLYEKSPECTVYCVTAQGYTEYINLNPSDEGRKVFTNKVVDGRKKIQTGASILVKDVQKVGKVYLGSFKDSEGSNIIGSLQGDTVENTSNFLLRNKFVDLFDKKYLVGQSQIIKGSQNQIFVICTIRESLTPQNSINQGQLTVFHVRKDRKCEFQLIYPENKCESFAVIPIGDSNWSIVSVHEDGSLHFSILQKPQKQVIELECKRLKEMQPVSSQKNIEKYSQLKQSIKKTINQDTLSEVQLHPVNYFRQFSEVLKNNVDYKISKKNLQYEITLLNGSKVATGFTLPFIGNVYFPHRTVKNTVQVGLSNLEVLHYFVEGTLKFRIQKIQDYKMGVDHKFKEKFQRFERLNEMAMDSERALQIINTIKQVESLGSDQVQFYGQSVDSFKNKITNFAEIFNEESTEQSKDKKVQKIVILLQIFIQDSIKNQNYLCELEEILEFVKNLRKISLGITKPEIYKIIKNLIVSSLKMHEAIIGTKCHVFNDEYYPLKYATEEKANYFYEILKGEVNDNQVEESINFWSEICNEDLSLGLLYLSKYPSLLAKIHKKSKKIDKLSISQKLLKIYVLGYQVLKFKDHNCDWILGGICSLFSGENKNKALRETFYQILIKYSNVELHAWLKNVQEVDGEENVSNVNLVPKISQRSEPRLLVEENLGALYGDFGMMGEMDEEAMIKMAIELSNNDMRERQEQHLGFNNIGNVIEEQKDNFDDHDMLMEIDEDEENESKRTFLKDLVEHCIKNINEPSQIASSRIIVLYVISKYVNEVENVPVFNEILHKVINILGDLSPSCDNIDKHILMAYLSVFSNILSTSKILKNNLSETSSELYMVIKEEVLNRLQNVKPEKVNKCKNQPNLLSKIFRGEKIYTFAHYAYGLVSLLLPPCEPYPILLSLECYWVLPESKEYYKKMKHMTTIKEGISTGNIGKLYEVAKLDPQVWRQNADIVWLQNYIESNKQGWEKALELLALYYENQRQSQ